MKIDTDLLKQHVSEKRSTESMDAVCKKIGISKPTYSRLERGKCLPDALTLLKVCVWLEKNPMIYIVPNKNQ